MDNLTKEQRKKNMQNIRSVNTKPELLLSHELWIRGYRYRKNFKKVFGKPDLCFLGKKVAIFCDSDFWHGKFFFEGIKIPQTNVDYWISKLTRNINRDKFVNETLRNEGWTVLRFWESDIENNLLKCVEKIENCLR